MEDQVKQNTQNIIDIKSDIRTIKDNHLFHMEKDMEKQSKMIEKIDQRLWWLLGTMLVSIVVSTMGDKLL